VKRLLAAGLLRTDPDDVAAPVWKTMEL